MDAIQYVPWFDRLVASLIQRRLRGADRSLAIANKLFSIEAVLFKTRYGSYFRLKPWNYIDRIVLREGYYESEVLEALNSAIPPNGVLWDVGANFGLHSVTLKKVRPDVRVICFEPSPDQAGRILEHARVNSVDVELVNCGLSDASKLSAFHMVNGNPGMNTFVRWGGATYDRSIQSWVVSGDELLREEVIPFPDVIKLDVEGGEMGALAGLRSVLLGGRTCFVVEGGVEIVSFFESRGMRCEALIRKENTAHSLENYIVRPRSKEQTANAKGAECGPDSGI